jgi:hypothetical protein
MIRPFRKSYRELFGFKMRQNVAADRSALANARRFRSFAA